MATRTQKRSKTEPEPSGFACSMPGCEAAGDYKAPVAPTNLREYRWFCLDHVREYNANWNYFTGMSAEEVESFIHNAPLGHRPTWQINQLRTDGVDALEAALRAFLHGNAKPRRTKTGARSVPKEERDALAVLNMEADVTLTEIKKRYKVLVKQHHPDVNPGDKAAEERFKLITQAYQELIRRRV